MNLMKTHWEYSNVGSVHHCPASKMIRKAAEEADANNVAIRRMMTTSKLLMSARKMAKIHLKVVSSFEEGMKRLKITVDKILASEGTASKRCSTRCMLLLAEAREGLVHDEKDLRKVLQAGFKAFRASSEGDRPDEEMNLYLNDMDKTFSTYASQYSRSRGMAKRVFRLADQMGQKDSLDPLGSHNLGAIRRPPRNGGEPATARRKEPDTRFGQELANIQLGPFGILREGQYFHPVLTIPSEEEPLDLSMRSEPAPLMPMDVSDFEEQIDWVLNTHPGQVDPLTLSVRPQLGFIL